MEYCFGKLSRYEALLGVTARSSSFMPKDSEIHKLETICEAYESIEHGKKML